jgi:hypothetical protein
MLTFDQPEIVTKVMLDVDQHNEHYIICPGGRDAFKQEVSFIYSFDLAAEKWTATTFPEMREPMFNMDAKIVELSDATHKLVVLSGQTTKGSMSSVIQGYNIERDYIDEVFDGGSGGVSFAGRPALRLRQFSIRNPNMYGQNAASTTIEQIVAVGGTARSTSVMSSSATVISWSMFFRLHCPDLSIDRFAALSAAGTGIVLPGNTGLPFGNYDYKVQTPPVIGNWLRDQGNFIRHHNLPVRAVFRQRPFTVAGSSTPQVDILLFGGFNATGYSQYDKTVVSGRFNPVSGSASAHTSIAANPYFMIQQSPFTNSPNNAGAHLLYPESPHVLGDCCAEYVAERDEVICFGGRRIESDNASVNDELAVLVFSQTDNSAAWNTNKYSPQPNPRWSAASVLIRDLVRQGESEPCDRIFIIGGRNKDGFVAEVDVFNLRYNDWETDWKGLDEGELETIPPSLGGGGVTINITGSSGVQSVKAGNGIEVTGTKANPIVSLMSVYG